MTDEIKQSSSVELVNIDEELKSSYLAYAMSVIVGRALPDVRDGLKPVHRRILYAMSKIGCDTMTRKSARIVGDVIGKYHPHGDSAAYDALVRLAQPFSMRYPLVDGQGNFGSIDGDPAAAQRYTEAMLAKICGDALADIDKDTVDFVPNFDGEEREPTVLPTKVPLLLVNGSNGIAVGMATSIPPHNLCEVIDATTHLMSHPDATTRDLMQFVKGPDFPTCGSIHGKKPIFEAYDTGRGKIRVRARVEEEVVHGHDALIVREIPYQVNKARLVEKIAQLVKDKKIEGIHHLRDESGRQGMRIVIEIKKDVPPQVVLNQLYKQTDLQTTFGVTMLAVVNNRPMLLTLKEVLSYFIEFRRDVTVRRTIFLLRQAKERAHILEGFRIALDNLDEVIAMIRSSEDTSQARERLMGRFELTEIQARAILELRLQRLTGMERHKILEELAEILRHIAEYETILGSKSRLDEIVSQELKEVKSRYPEGRRTVIYEDEGEIEYEDLIADEFVMVTRTKQNYIKRQALAEYRAQKRGGRGKLGMGTKEDDYVQDLFVATSHQRMLIFTSLGRVFALKVYELPPGGRTTKGRPIVNMLPKLDANESIETILPLPLSEDDYFVMMATQEGVIKKTSLTSFARINKTGVKAISFREGDRLISARLVRDSNSVLLAAASGASVRFSSTDLRPMSRTAMGVRGMKLRKGDRIIGMEIIGDPDGLMLTVTQNGYGKRTPISDHRIQTRGGLGIRAIQANAKTGHVVSALLVGNDDHLLIVTDNGTIIRVRVHEIRITGRNASGVRLMNTAQDEHVVAVARIASQDDDEEEISQVPEPDELDEGETEDEEEIEEEEVDSVDLVEDESLTVPDDLDE
ncbi:MAG: DNA gyrase subunit A [Proteobacteria bacterium]|nr:DNA gyrase subunit A [Pseudomonadota bacterium]